MNRTDFSDYRKFVFRSPNPCSPQDFQMAHTVWQGTPLNARSRPASPSAPTEKAPEVALWAKLPDYESWRLVLASDRLDQTSQLTGYTQISEAMEKAGIPIHRQPSVLLRPMSNPMIEDLRKVFAVAKETYGMRVGGQTFGDKYIEGAFVYRIR